MSLKDVINVIHLGLWHHQEEPIQERMLDTFGEAAYDLIEHALHTPWACAI